MKVKDLIAALQLCDQELEVYGYSDHGQSPEKASSPQVIYTESNDAHRFWEGEWRSYPDDAEELELKCKAILL